MITQIPVTYHMVCAHFVWQATCIEKAHPAFERSRSERVEKKNSRSGLKGKRWHQLQCCVCAAGAGTVDGLEMVDDILWG